MLAPFLLSIEALRNGRKEFSPEERARVELSRFRCFLLGLPEALLGTTPEEIAGLMLTRHATLRKSFDDATCGVLVRGTMAAKLSNDNSFGGRLSRRLEMGFSKAFFVRNFTDGDPAKAAKIGVPLTVADRFFAVVSALLIFPKMFAYDAASKVGFLRDGADQRLIRKIEHLCAPTATQTSPPTAQNTSRRTLESLRSIRMCRRKKGSIGALGRVTSHLMQPPLACPTQSLEQPLPAQSGRHAQTASHD